MMNLNSNVILILVAFAVAMLAVYALYAIIIPKGNDLSKDSEFQLTTKNILEHVRTLYDKGEYALVELLALKYLERMPSHLEVRQYLADAFFKDKKYNNAIKQCLAILKRDPDNIGTKKILGKCYMKKNMPGKALKEFEEIFDQKSNDLEAIRMLAELYRETEQIYSSISVYNILSGLASSNAEIAEIQGILAELNEEIHDYPAAFEAYKTRLGIYPNDVETNKNLVILYIKLNNTAKAIETLLYMLSFVTEPKELIWVYENLIQLFVETEEYEKAIEYSNKLLDIQGVDKFKIRNDIASFNLKLNNFNAGIKLLEELVLMSQSAYDVTVELAQAYIQQKEYEKALERYTILLDKSTPKEAKSIRSLICDMYILWAIDYIDDKKYAKALELLDKAYSYNVLNSELYYNKALVNFEQKNFTTCVEFLNNALKYDKSNTFHIKYFLKLSEAHHELGNFFEEKKALSDLLKIDPDNAMGLYRSGLMYVSQHDSKNAEECFNKALDKDPHLTLAKYNLALLYENNNREKAKSLYIEVLEENSDFLEARNALNELTSVDYY